LCCKEATGVILFVSMSKAEQHAESGGGVKFKLRFEELTGHPCLVVHYSMVSPEFMARYPVRAMFIGGFGYGWDQFDVKASLGLNDVVHGADLPILAACGGHQFLGFAFNKNLRRVKRLKDEPMRRLRPGEADVHPGYHPGYFTEIGCHHVRIVRRDALFKGLPRDIIVPEAHYCEVKRLPKDFVLLASNENCKIQAMRHRERPVYGTQFHAENWEEPYLHGRQIISNFFALAGLT
jgi:anthranilate/para-aminobenzoate synthase component II